MYTFIHNLYLFILISIYVYIQTCIYIYIYLFFLYLFINIYIYTNIFLLISGYNLYRAYSSRDYMICRYGPFKISLLYNFRDAAHHSQKPSQKYSHRPCEKVAKELRKRCENVAKRSQHGGSSACKPYHTW